MSTGREKYIFNTTLDEMLDKQSKDIELLETRLKDLATTESKCQEIRRYLYNVTSAECDISKYIRSEVQRYRCSQASTTNKPRPPSN